MKRNLITLFVIVICAFTLNAQDEFKPSGKPSARVFTNFHYDLGENSSAFELLRAYIGYSYNLSPYFSTNMILDVGSPEVDINDSTTTETTYHFTAFLKTAALTYKKDKIRVDLGMIGLQQMKLQEQYWGHRYIYKSFQDWSKMGTTADLGGIVSYSFNDFLSADLTVRNGEGYKIIQNDNAYRSAIGITVTPGVEGLVFRGFYDYIEKQEAMFTISHFAGYQNEKISVGGEYNLQLNAKDTKDQTLSGLSLYTSYTINNKIEVFGRYDILTSNKIDGETISWNNDNDGQLFIAGLQFSPIRNVQFAVDYQGFVPSSDDDMVNQLFFHVQFSY